MDRIEVQESGKSWVEWNGMFSCFRYFVCWMSLEISWSAFPLRISQVRNSLFFLTSQSELFSQSTLLKASLSARIHPVCHTWFLFLFEKHFLFRLCLHLRVIQVLVSALAVLVWSSIYSPPFQSCEMSHSDLIYWVASSSWPFPTCTVVPCFLPSFCPSLGRFNENQLPHTILLLLLFSVAFHPQFFSDHSPDSSYAPPPLGTIMATCLELQICNGTAYNPMLTQAAARM